METKIPNGIVTDLTSAQYHAMKGTYSSSQLKDLLKNPKIFHKKYILKTEEKLEMPAFDIGTYFHTSILEPEKLQIECAVYKGIRRGKEWEAFKEANKGKAIITESELAQAEMLVQAVKDSPVAMGRLSRGTPEISAFTNLTIFAGEIFSECGKILGRHGWEKTKLKANKKTGVPLTIKVRADLLADDFILDLKSTTGDCESEYDMRGKVSNYFYDLSASLYLDIFSLVKDRKISEFIWTFASKDIGNSKSYIATEENILVGRAKYKKALLTLANCINNKWAFEDAMGFLAPNAFELEHIRQKSEDLL